MISFVGLDADDTLWHSQNHYDATQETIAALASEWASPEVFSHELLRIERRNVMSFGFGVKSFTLSAIQTMIELSDGTVDPTTIEAVIEAGRELLEHPVELIDGVLDALTALADTYELVVITKGDLLHQQRKLDESGLAAFFDHTHIVSDKNPATYERIVEQLRIRPNEMLMAGNSLPSDVLPADAAGLHAVHLPYHLEWSYEAGVDSTDSIPTLESIRHLPDHIEALNDRLSR